jgi:tRNA (guanine-N1)-methyltransferase
MQFDVISLFPELVENYCSLGIIGRAQKDDLINLNSIQLREFGLGKYKKVDDEIYGGGAGMLLMPEPLFSAYESIPKKDKSKTILLTPSGAQLTQPFIRNNLMDLEQIVIFCGRYEGFDERVMELVDYPLSIGPYVLTGGEIGAMVIIDAVTRLLPGVLSKGELAHGEDSYADENGCILEAPQYTRPANFRGMQVPDLLVQGNHQEIKKWRKQNSRRLN